MRVINLVLALVVSLVFIGKVMAADQACSATKAEHHEHLMGPWNMLKGLDLTDEQKVKVKEAGKEFHEKIKAILTPEQQEKLKAKMAERKAEGKTTKPERHGPAMMGPWNMLKGLDLTDEQKAKVKDLRKDYGVKFKEVADSVLTADQKKARDDAIKAAKDAGKKGPEVFEAARVAVNLTDEQKAKMHEAMKPLGKDLQEKTKAILTPEQQEKLKAKMPKHKAESK